MSHSSSTARPTDHLDPGTIGAVVTRLGLGVIALTVPVVVGALAGLFATAGTPAVGITIALRALSGPLLGGFGLPWLFHVATLAALCGCWLLGAGLLLEGLYD